MLSQLSESVSFPRPVPMGAVICLPHAQPRMKGDFCKVHFVSDSAEAEVVLLGFLSIPFTNFAVYQFLARGVHPSYQGSRLSLVPGTNTGVDISDDTCEPGLASAASYMNPFPVLRLVEDLRLALEMLEHSQERAALLSQIPGPTAAYMKEWFEESVVSRPMAWVGNTVREPLACHHHLGLSLHLCTV